MKIGEWIKKGETSTVAKTRIFNVCVTEKQSKASSKTGVFASIDAPDWVVCIPTYVKDDITYVIMVRQYRHGSSSITLEFPCGCVEKNEAHVDAAKRELQEETGAISSKEPIRLGSVSPNSAFMTNRSLVYLFEDVKVATEQNLDENEEIEVVHLPLDEVILNRIADEKEGDNSIMAVAAFLYMKYKGRLK